MVQEQTKARTVVRVPGVVGGEPVLEGTRLPVRTIVLAHFHCGYDVSCVRQDYPRRTVADIEAALAFYRAHRDEINGYIAENNEGEDILYDELARL